MRTFCIGLFLLYGTTAYADDVLEIQKMNAFLTYRAFECSEFSPNKEEKERLANLGLQAGRDFIQFWEAHPDSRDSFSPIWRMLRGPTPDFKLGQLLLGEVLIEEMLDLMANFTIKAIKAKMYQEKKCAFLRNMQAISLR